MGIAHENTRKYDPLVYGGIEEWKGQHKEPTKMRWFPSYRLLVALAGMMCLLANFASQDSMSSAMVCMIRQGNSNVSTGFETQFPENTSTKSDTPRYTVEEIEHVEENQAWFFDWSSQTQGWILFSFFLCYYSCQIPSGLLVARLGPTRVLVVGQLCSGLGHFLTVPATQLGLTYVYVIRIFTGLSTGFLYSAVFDLIAKWAPKQEISMMYSIAGAGIDMGNTFAFGVSTFACELSFQGGWPVVFYCIGGLQIMLALLMFWRVTDDPMDNKYISEREAMFIERGIPGKGKGKIIIPLRQILKSMPVYAATISQFGSMLMYYTIVTQGPNYLRDIIHLSSFEINIVAAMPFLAVIPMVNVFGWFSDWTVERKIFTTTSLRKVMDLICKLLGISALVYLAFAPEHDTTSAFMCYLLVAMSVSVSYVGYVSNAGDLSPAHAGFITSIQQFGSLWVSFVMPPVVGAVAHEKTRDGWQMIFLGMICVQALTYVFFLKFGSGDLQPWAVEEDYYEIIVSSEDCENGKLISGQLPDEDPVVHGGSTQETFWGNGTSDEKTPLVSFMKHDKTNALYS